MKRSLHGILPSILLAAAAFWSHGQEPSIPTPKQLKFADNDRVLVLAPHPDDEVLTCGGVLQECATRKIPARVVFLTYGDNNQWSFIVYRKRPVLETSAVRQMGILRHDEAVSAADILGIARDSLTFLGYPDFGTLRIWNSHWDTEPPLESGLTRAVSVPYTNAFRPNAPYTGDEILADIKTVLLEFKPTRILVSHPADHNPDHQALYLFTRVALWDLQDKVKAEVLPYLTHFRHWPTPHGFAPNEALAPPGFFKSVHWYQFAVSSNAVAVKRKAIQTHQTQYGYSAKYLDAFMKSNELFGDFPDIVFHERDGKGSHNDDDPVAVPDPPVELTEQERNLFTGIESKRISFDGTNIVLFATLSRPLAETVEFAVHMMGYREDCPFAKMPKIHVAVGIAHHGIRDQKERLDDRSVQVRRGSKFVEVGVPLQLLGDPDRILISARTSLSGVPLDWSAWRAIEIEPCR